MLPATPPSTREGPRVRRPRPLPRTAAAWALALGLCAVALIGCSADADSTGAAEADAASGDASAADAPNGADGAGADGAGVDSAAAWQPDPRLLAEGVLNIAHRGGKTERPEHTLAAYTNALEAGADLIELDVHRSKDGVLVSIHDVTVDRTTDGKGAVKDLTWAQLKQLDAGYSWSKDGGKTHPFRGKGHTIARVDETLDAFPNALISVEIKQYDPSIVDDLVALFTLKGAMGRTIFSSFADATTAKLRERAPTALTAMAMGELLLFRAMDDSEVADYVAPCRFVQPPEDMVDAAFMTRAHAVGLKVQPWTVNKAERMKALLKLGIDGLFTDDPRTFAGLLP